MKLLLLIAAGILAWFLKNQAKNSFATSTWWSRSPGLASSITFIVLWIAILSIGFPTLKMVFTDTMSAGKDLPVQVDPTTGKPLVDPDGKPISVPTEIRELKTTEKVREYLVGQLADLIGLPDEDGDGYSDPQEIRLGWDPNVYTVVK